MYAKPQNTSNSLYPAVSCDCCFRGWAGSAWYSNIPVWTKGFAGFFCPATSDGIDSFFDTVSWWSSNCLTFKFCSSCSRLIYISWKQQELQRNLVSTEAISKTTIHFFHELQRQVSKLLKNLEHDQLEKSRRLAAFEKNFVVNDNYKISTPG